MQVGIEEVGYSLLWALVLLLCCFSGCYWKDRVWLMLVAGVMVVSYEDEKANCARLEKEFGVALARMHKLEVTDSTERDIRNFLLRVGGFIIPPL